MVSTVYHTVTFVSFSEHNYTTGYSCSAGTKVSSSRDSWDSWQPGKYSYGGSTVCSECPIGAYWPSKRYNHNKF